MLDPDRDWLLPLEEIQDRILSGEYTARLSLNGGIVVRDTVSGQLIKGTAHDRQLSEVKAEMRAALLNWGDEGGFKMMIKAIERHMDQKLPQWQVMKMILEYTVGPPTDKVADSTNDFFEKVLAATKARDATIMVDSELSDD